jgi:hypothetical protein
MPDEREITDPYVVDTEDYLLSQQDLDAIQAALDDGDGLTLEDAPGIQLDAQQVAALSALLQDPENPELLARTGFSLRTLPSLRLLG